MATRDQMIADALKDLKHGLDSLNNKFDTKLDNYAASMNDFGNRMTKVETRINIVFGIMAAIGIAMIGALVKYIVK